MSNIPTTVTIAPRGQAFGVVRLDQVVGDKVLPVFVKGNMPTRAEADKVAAGIDARLQPTVILYRNIDRSPE